jgi:hypothetical protein
VTGGLSVKVAGQGTADMLTLPPSSCLAAAGAAPGLDSGIFGACLSVMKV